MQSQPLFAWFEPIRELAMIVGAVLTAGAIGFRYAVVRDRATSATGIARGAAPIDAERTLYADAARRAAMLGLVGSLLAAGHALLQVSELAARRSLSVGELVTSDAMTAVRVAMLLLAVIGFALAAARRGMGWHLATAGVLVGTLREAVLGQWARLVNPLHMLAAGLWIGTLFVLVVAGLSAVLRAEPVRERRGAIVADMVNAFSPLALASGGVLVLFGLITAWRHLRGVISNLWTTPYGWALMAKLCVVEVVFTLGAWNWRRQRPSLGTEEAATAIRRSARSELVAAGVVLVLTAILLSIPAPPRPGAPAAVPPRAAAP